MGDRNRIEWRLFNLGEQCCEVNKELRLTLEQVFDDPDAVLAYLRRLRLCEHTCLRKELDEEWPEVF